jgi:predicted mannosyl-3-phosphoglycerate phosphatase (HAD superfamily)
MFSNAPVYLVKNTRKEELESKIIKSWEANDLGRSEQANKIRERNLCLIKQSNSQVLSDKERQIIAQFTAFPSSNNSKQSQNSKIESVKKTKPSTSGNGSSFLDRLNMDYLEDPESIKKIEFSQ